MIRNGIRTALCIVLAALAYMLQTSIGVRFSVLGVHIDLLPLITACAGVVLGSGTGLACGLAAGILYDLSGSSIEGIYPLYYMLWGIASGFAGKRFRGMELVAVMLCAAAMMTSVSLLRYLFVFQFSGIDALAFGRTIVLQAVLTVVLSPVVLFLVHRIAGRKRKKNTALLNE